MQFFKPKFNDWISTNQQEPPLNWCFFCWGGVNPGRAGKSHHPHPGVCEVDYYLAQLLADHCVLGSANCSLEVPVMLWCYRRWKGPERCEKTPGAVDVVGLIMLKGIGWREQYLELRRLTGSSKSNENSQLQKQKWLWFFQKGVLAGENRCSCLLWHSR